MSTQTSIPASHKAAALNGSTEDGKLIKIIDTPTLTPPADRILIKVKSNAFNPTDWKHAAIGWGVEGCIAGSDAAGVVAAVGSDVKGFAVGDHVSAFTHGGYKAEPTAGAFQEYLVAQPSLTIKYDTQLQVAPEADKPAPITTFEGAASVTLGLVTIGLTYAHNFKLSFDKKDQAGKILLIWGASGATGLLATQVAKQIYGLTVYAVASRKNHALLKDLGADQTFDYHDEDVLDQIKKAGGDDIVYGFDTVSDETSLNLVYQVLSETKPAILENLLFLNESVIKKTRPNVTVTFSLAYLATGKTQYLGDLVLGPDADLLESHAKFWPVITKYVNSGAIKHAPLKYLKGGLNAVDEGLSLLRNNKVSGQKLIIDI